MMKKTDATPNQKLLTIEEAEALVHQALEKGANPWTFTHHVWAILETQVKAYLKLPTFRANILDMLDESDKGCRTEVYDENLSKVVRSQPLLRLFKNDLVRNMILCLNNGQIPEQLRTWKPFGGDHYYHELKDRWYSEKQKDLNHTWLESSLDMIVAEHNNRVVKDPELPYWKDQKPHPSEIEISLINLHTLQFEWGNEMVTVNCKKQIGLHGSEGLISKQKNEPNTNMRVLHDLWLHTDKVLDMIHTGYQEFKNGDTMVMRNKASHQISKVNTALNKIVELAIDPDTGEPHRWFRLEKQVYIPQFSAGEGGIDILRGVLDTIQVKSDVKDLPVYDDATTPAELGYASANTDRYGEIKDY